MQAHAGILIRSIENLTDNQIIEGPSLTVDHILNLNDVASIDELVTGFDLEALNKNSKLYISSCTEFKQEQVYTCPRYVMEGSTHPFPFAHNNCFQLTYLFTIH